MDILVIGDVSLEELVDISFPILLEYGELISAKDRTKPFQGNLKNLERLR